MLPLVEEFGFPWNLADRMRKYKSDIKFNEDTEMHSVSSIASDTNGACGKRFLCVFYQIKKSTLIHPS